MKILLLIFLIGIFTKSLLTAKKVNRSSTGKRTAKIQDSAKGDIKETSSIDPYFLLGKHLFRYDKKGRLGDFTLEEVSRAVKSLATAHAAWKTMDGATHQLRNAFKSSTSLQSRFNKFISRKSRNTKEAVKLYEYVTTVERGLQTTEILQSAMEINIKKRERYLRDAGLIEVARYIIKEKNVNIVLSILQPIDNEKIDPSTVSTDSPFVPRFASNETILCIYDNPQVAEETHIASLLRIATTEKPKSLGMTSSTKTPTIAHSTNSPIKPPTVLQYLPTYLRVAEKVCIYAKEWLLDTDSMVDTVASDTTNNKTESTTKNTAHNKRKASRVRILGYSSGSAVGAYVAMILDGLLDPSFIAPESTTAAVSLHGVYRHLTKAFLVGCPPCLSREIVPKYITSIICGDDLIPRCSLQSFQSFQDRIAEGLQVGAGKAGIGWMLGTGIWKDFQSIAGKSFKKYKVRKMDSGGLNILGRVFFMKSRQLKQGATLQRILRGNWQEDVLWNIHDILLSKKMLEHHTLPAYIRTLNRC